MTEEVPAKEEISSKEQEESKISNIP